MTGGPLGLLAGAVAWAGAVEVAVTDGPLRPGRATTVEVSAADASGVPTLRVDNATARALGEVRPAVWAWQLVPGEGEVVLVARHGEEQLERRVPSAVPPPSRLDVPKQVEGVAGTPQVRFVVGSAGLPADAVEVAPGEGRVVSLTPVDDGVEVLLELADTPFPRVVPVGVRDVRTDDAPRWVAVRLRARPRLPLQAEPGVTVHLTVGDRSYGPFVADAQGRIEAVVDQYPGETAARARLVDDLGNETSTDLPLSSVSATSLVGMVAGERLPGTRPPLVFLHAVRGDGRSVGEGPPRCQTPEAELAVWPVQDGWVAAAPPLDPDVPTDLRVSCRLDSATRELKVPVTEGVADRLRVRIWPDELRTDYPVAEVRVVLEDARGDRLDTAGVQVRAVRGDVEMEGSGGIVARGDYVGDGAVSAGNDTLVATWSAPAGRGPVRGLGVAWSPAEEQQLMVHGRARDRLGRPLAGVPVVLSAGSARANAVTDDSGHASVELPRPEGVVRVSAAAGPWVAERLAPPGSVFGGPGSPDLSDAVGVTIRPGLIAGLSVEVDPPLLRAGPGSVAWVYVALEDRSGAPVTDTVPSVSVSEGTLGPLRPRGDGRFVAEYTPAPGGGVRDVTVTAESDGVRTATRLAVQPRNVRVALGPWLGWQSNLGEVSSPVVGADLDLRLRSQLIGETLMLRLGATGYGVDAEVRQAGQDLQLQAAMVPAHVALLLRDDPGAYGVWAGAGGALAMQRVRLSSPLGVLADGTRWLVGPTAIVGAGRRLLGGEAFVEARASWLSGRTGQVGFSGNVGGLGVGLGWRVVY